MANYISKLLRGAGTIFLLSSLSSAFSYLTRILLAKKLSTAEFGLFFAVYNIVLLVGWLKTFGLYSALKKYVPEYKVNNDNVGIKSTLVFIMSFAIITSIIFLLLAYFFPTSITNSC